jgi:membrane-associated phospholipid phosphatase
LSAVKRSLPIVAALIAIAVAFLGDRWTYDHVVMANVYDKDWGRMLRIIGFVPTWMAIALGFWLHERDLVPHARRKALLIVASPIFAGIVDELLKLVFRRERPGAHDGEYFFRAWSERTFSTSGLALPSSHTMVAFGGAFMLAYLYPRTRWLWFALAAGCSLTRLLAHAHFLSDVVVATIGAFATTAWLWNRYGKDYFLRSV